MEGEGGISVFRHLNWETPMAPLDNTSGVWKSGRGKGRKTPKGRQLDDQAHSEILDLLGERPRDRDLLIEFLHLVQDKFGYISAAHIRARNSAPHRRSSRTRQMPTGSTGMRTGP